MILSVCYNPEDLWKYLKIDSLLKLPIRAAHYNDLLMLFRKAHGPLLQSGNKLPYDKGQKQKKEIEEAVATPRSMSKPETVKRIPGFVHF